MENITESFSDVTEYQINPLQQEPLIFLTSVSVFEFFKHRRLLFHNAEKTEPFLLHLREKPMILRTYAKTILKLKLIH